MRTCVFCGGSPVTREHVWPQWLNTYPSVAKAESGSFVKVANGAPASPVLFKSTLEKDESQRYVAQKTVRAKRQQPHQNVVRAVCAVCNGGWMSALESRVSPVVRRLIEGPTTVSRKEAIDLAKWVAKTAMMNALVDPTTSPFLDDEYAAMANGRVPDPTRIWMCRTTKDVLALSSVNKTALGWETDPDVAYGSRPNVVSFFLAVEGLAFLMHHSKFHFATDLVLPSHLTSGWVSLWPKPGAIEWPKPFVRPAPLSAAVDWLVKNGPQLDPSGLTKEEAADRARSTSAAWHRSNPSTRPEFYRDRYLERLTGTTAPDE